MRLSMVLASNALRATPIRERKLVLWWSLWIGVSGCTAAVSDDELRANKSTKCEIYETLSRSQGANLTRKINALVQGGKPGQRDDCTIVAPEGANLARINLGELDLTGASFSGANLYGASFTRANLTNANFDRADLVGTNFSRANLDGATFRGALIHQTNFAGVILQDSDGRDLRPIDFGQARCSGDAFYFDRLRVRNAPRDKEQCECGEVYPRTACPSEGACRKYYPRAVCRRTSARQ